MPTPAAKTRNTTKRLSILLFLIGTGVACTNLGMVGGIFTHPDLGYTIPGPNGLDGDEVPVWRAMDVKRTDLAFRGPGDAYLAISSHCDETVTDPAILARQLLVGLKQRERVSSERFEFAGGQAYRQTIESILDDTPLRTRTVTLVRADCVVDWALVAKKETEGLDSTFDLWWQSFDPGAMPGSASVAVEAPDEVTQ